MAQSSGSPNFSEYRTVKEAAEFLGVSTATLRNWDRNGKLTPRRHPQNGYRIYLHEELEALLHSANISLDPDDSFAPPIDWSEMSESDHFVQFYESDAFLVESVSGFVGEALNRGNSSVIIATAEHRNTIQRKLAAAGIDLAEAIETGRYVVLDASETLTQLMLDGLPDPGRFMEIVGGVIAQVAHRDRPIHAFGEMVALLWADGNRAAAVRLEELWNELAKSYRFALFCAYPLNGFDDESDATQFHGICNCHSRVIPSESYAAVLNPDERMRAVTSLQQKAKSLEAEIVHRSEVQKMLLKREQELADFFENATEGLHKVGADGKILWANKAELDLLGYRSNEYIGHHIADFYIDKDLIEDILERLLSGQNLFNQPAQLRCKDGSVKEVLIHSNAYFEAGRFIYSRCFTRDVTELKQAERDRAMLAAIVESSEDAIIGKTLDGIIRSWNRAAERIFGYSEREAVGQPITLIIPPERSQEEPEILARLRRGQRVEHFETVRIAKSGRRIDISLTISPLRDTHGKLIGASKVARDITDRKRAEDAVRIADRRKDEFLATLAHELRNPLAPIKNGLALLHHGVGDEDLAKEVRGMMDRQVDQMTRLVDDLLDVSRITRNKIELRKQRVDLATIVKSAIETSRPLIESARHELAIKLPSHPIYLDADATRLAQVFSNLLNNSAKYTEPGGRIDVEAERRGSKIVITVRDNGVGISCEELAHVFDMFRQVDRSLERSQGGLGIGLTLVRRLVELHGGTVTAQSEGPGKGSEFIVHLPTTVWEADEGTKSHPEPSTNSSKVRVLVVDDNADSVASLSKLLEITGNEVRMAQNGLDAIEIAAQFRPEVILMDVGMPKLNGYDATRRIRELPWGKDIVIVALSGWGQGEDVQRSIEAGCSAHLTKPVDFAVLRQVLASRTSSTC